MKKFLIGFGSALLFILVVSLVGVFLYNQIWKKTKNITALKPITYSTGQDELMARYRSLTINAIDEDNKNCVVVYIKVA